MEMKELLKQHAYACCINWLLMVGILQIINDYYGLEIQGLLTLLLPLVWVVLLRSFDQNKKNVIPYIMLVLFAIIVYAMIWITNYPFLQQSKKYVKWLSTTLQYGANKSIIYSLITITFFMIIISIPCYIVLKRYRLRLLSGVVLFVLLITITVTRNEIPKLSVCCFLTYIMIAVMEGWLNRFYTSFLKRSIKVMTFLVPFTLLMTIALLLLPAKKEPIQWTIVKNCWQGIVDLVESIGEDIDLWLHPEKAEFSLNFAGYSEDGTLGGGIEFKDSLALMVELTSLQNSNIYLTGNVKNKFDGREWTYMNKEDVYLEQAKEYEYDLYEFAYALYREGITTENYNDYFKVLCINIEYKEIVTKALFYPLKMTLLQNLKKADDFYDKTANVCFEDAKGEDTRYRANYLYLNLGSEHVNQFLKNQSQFSYQKEKEVDYTEFRKYLKDIAMLSNAQVPKVLENRLYQRANNIKQQYTSIYESLPKRVSDLAVEITKGYESDYDKLLAIERFLSTYTYTTQPSQPPEGEDLIDYMLFESKEGYCTYYATAFAIMARCINIPTRYVQGFCVDTVNQQDRYLLKASSGNAHAWVEAYLEGVGWLPFEPTPTYVDKRYQPWAIQGEVIAKKPEYNVQPTIPVILGGEEDEAERLAIELHNREKKLAYQSVLYVLIGIVILIFLAVPVYLLLKQAYRNKLYHEASTEEKVYLDICLLLSIFGYCGRKIRMGETFCGYMKEIRKAYSNQEKDLLYLEQVFLRLRYNDEDISQEEQRKVEQIREGILREVHGRRKKLKYIKMRVALLQTGRNKVT